ncbi:MAG: VCBS repeat-containing protein [Actinobacteria bacterium]|nr:VCBS repeat-containing protein [Actinomycetota bacterium]
MPLRGRHRSALAAALTAVVALALAACSGGDDDTSATPTSSGPDSSAGGLTVELGGGRGAVPVGEPLDVTATVSNHGSRSLSASIDLSLVMPDGTEMPFHRTTLFVPFGDSVSETVVVTPSRWTPATGAFEVTAAVTDPAAAAASGSFAFEVEPTTRVVPVFEDVTQQAGVVTDVPDPVCGQFANGAAWGDIDGDGRPDLAVTRLGEPAQLFVNQADGTFVEESATRGTAVSDTNGAAFADYDDDGDADLMLVGDGSDVLLRNDGTGRFADVTAEAGVAGDPSHRGMSATWGDYDGDGLLDLYVTNYMDCSGPWTTEEEIVANVDYHADVLYHNEGDGSFADVTDELPGSDDPAAGFTAAWLDADSDGLLDLYLANDFVGLSPDHNRLWRNTGAGTAGWTFEDVSLDSGAGLYMNTMGVGIGDVDRDGDLDLALSNIGGNKLLRGNGDATFVEETASGIERPSQGIDYSTITWGTVVADFDLDGWDDVFMAAGNLPQAPEVKVGEQPNMLFLNDGTGQHFLDVSSLTGADGVGESKGVAAADYDGDGALDLFVVDQSGQPHLYRNVTPREGRHWLELDLAGTQSNADACGAFVHVAVAGATISRVQLCGSGASGSGHDHRIHIGLGTAASVDSIEIIWPSGVRQLLDDVGVDQVVSVVEPSS